MSFRGNNIFTDTESEDDYNNVNSTARSISPCVSNVSSNSNSSSDATSSSSSSSSSGSDSSESSDEVPAIPSLHAQSTQHLQETTDDENVLSLQSSPSPYASDMEEIEQPTPPRPPAKSQRQKKQQQKNDNYLDPDLYCLRRSNRQKDKASTTPEESEEMTYTTDEEVQESSSDDDYGKSFSTSTHNRKRSNTRQKNITRSKQTRVIYESDDDDEEESSTDDDEWGSTKPKTKRSTNRSKRLRQRNTGTISPSDFARHSTRSRKVTNYNEDNAELWGLSDDDIGTGDSYTPAPAEEDEGEVIEAVLDHRKREGYESEVDDPETNIEYLIKWKTWSHLHDTWDNYEYLRSFKGFRKLENYVRNRIIEEQFFRSHSETTKEEIEQQDINIARRRDEIQDWRTVERITAARGSPPDIEYFVKWKRLHYNECTWESADVIAADYQAEIDEFLEREQNVYIPHKSTSYPRGNRPDFVDFKTQPAFISGGELRDYQLLGVNWMYYLWCRNENGILADEMGLGKTVQTISFLNALYHHRHLYGPFLIVVPLSTSDNWMQEFKQWAPQMNVICYLGNRPAREAIRNTEFYLPGTKRLKFNVVITTYEIVLKDKDIMGNIRWQYLAVDEAHRLKNADSQLYEALSSFHTTNRLLITGTPLQNNIKELLALVRFLMPNMDLSQYQFDLDVADVNQEEKIKALHGSIKSLMLRRLKKDVEKSLPNKSERILRVEMSELQKTYYKHILAKNFDLLSSGTENKKQWLNIAIELKKASNHPFLFPDVETPSNSRTTQLKGLIENSGKMVLLDQLLTRLKTDGHRVLIFSQLVMMLDILSDYMTLRGHPFQRLDGSMKPEDRNKAIEHYNSPGSPDFAFLLSTRAGGMGINLVTADTVIIFDSDWNPQNDLQAMSRAHRIGQTKSVNVYRFVTKGTMEEDIIERAKRKMILEYCVIKQMDTSGISLLQDHQSAMTTSGGKNRDIPFNRAEMSAVLKFGAKNMFEQPDNTETVKDIDLDDILSRAEHTETLEGEGSTLGSEDFLAQFKITDYGGTANDLSWDDIIPNSERAKLEQEQHLEDQTAMFDRAAKRGRITYSENNVDEEEELARTKKRRRPAASGGSSTSSKRRSSSSGKPDELIERDRRAIVRAVLKYGDIEARYAEAVSDSDLEHKDKDIILALYMDLISHCKEKVREQAEAHNTIPKGSQPTEEMLLRELRHTKQKAILFTWRDIQSVNAGQILQRHHDMKILASRLNPLNDQYKFRVSLGAKRVQGWSCAWGPKEDSMLLVGVHKYGFGSWPLIQADTPLGLSDKFFIGDEDKKTPKAIHLVRRAEQMMKILAEEEKMRNENTKTNYRTATSKSASNTSLLKKGPRSKQQQQKERQEAHQSSQQHHITKLPTSTNIKSPMASHHHDASSSSEALHIGSITSSTSQISKKRKSRTSDTTPRPSGKRAEKENKVPERTYESYDEDSAYSSMRPIKHVLKRLRDDSDKAERAEKAQIIKECMLRIGRHIDREVAEHPRNDNLKRDLWLYTLDYWPGKNITLDNLILVYEKIVEAIKAASTNATTTMTTTGSSTSHHSENNGSRDHHRRSSNYSHSSSHYHRSPSPSKNRHNSSRKDSAGSNKRRSSYSYHPYRHDKDENNGHDHGSNSSNRRRRSSSSHRSDDHHRRDRKSYDKYDRDRTSISGSSNKERRR